MNEFIKDTALRCAWTFAEAMLGCMTVGQTLTDIHWKHALSVSAVAALICLFKQAVKYAQARTEDPTDFYLEEIEYNEEKEI